jgi:hypothetical protein
VQLDQDDELLERLRSRDEAAGAGHEPGRDHGIGRVARAAEGRLGHISQMYAHMATPKRLAELTKFLE